MNGRLPRIVTLMCAGSRRRDVTFQGENFDGVYTWLSRLPKHEFLQEEDRVFVLERVRNIDPRQVEACETYGELLDYVQNVDPDFVGEEEDDEFYH